MNDEHAQIDELYSLIRTIYRARQADEIIASFASVFAAQSTAAERLEVITYWIDFYRLQRYRQRKKRRRPTITERVTPCSACGYPTSHRHHLWEIASHGENEVTIQLCANCHELQHLFYNALVRASDYSQKLALHALFSGQIESERAAKLLGWCLATIRYEARSGWLPPGRDAQAWVEERLHWSEFWQRMGAEQK